VRGVIDWIGWVSADRTIEGLTPRDIKAGSTPGKPMQLKIYGIALEDYLRYLDIESPSVAFADFFMTKEGKPKGGTDLSAVSRDDVVVAFERMEAGIAAGDFPPNPSPGLCRRCSVNFSCAYRQD
jgi:hypothetical protein